MLLISAVIVVFYCSSVGVVTMGNDKFPVKAVPNHKLWVAPSCDIDNSLSHKMVHTLMM